jgi:hypothetical protein
MDAHRLVILRVTRSLLESLLHTFSLKKKNLALQIREREERKDKHSDNKNNNIKQNMNAIAEERRSARATG